MSGRRLALSIVLVTLGTPCAGQVEGEVSPADGTAQTGSDTTIAIQVDVGSGGETLGSYGGSITWDPAVLRFTGWTGGDPPFETPVVNTADVTTGLLSCADASATGGQGLVRLLSVSFEALAEPPATTDLDLEFSSMFGAGDFEDLVPQLEVADGTTCVSDFAYGLRVTDTQNTIVTWDPIPQAVSYDVLRGDLSGLVADVAAVHLGAVTCVENDSLDSTTGAGSEPANPDTTVPSPGSGFFYLVRFHDGSTNRTYGYFEDCARERVVDVGDCL